MYHGVIPIFQIMKGCQSGPLIIPDLFFGSKPYNKVPAVLVNIPRRDRTTELQKAIQYIDGDKHEERVYHGLKAALSKEEALVFLSEAFRSIQNRLGIRVDLSIAVRACGVFRQMLQNPV